MSLFIASIASGSNGNCYYIGNEQEAVLVDAGISCRETVKRMRRIGLSIEKVKAIFVSHEHGDHIRGLDVLSRRYNLPVYITPATQQHSRLLPDRALVRSFRAYEPVSIGSITVRPFPKLHDAIDPHSFIVSCDGTNIGVLTDIGSPCEHVIEHFKQCHAVFLETNYDDVMLEQGRYPYHLKKRISGNEGHLSNQQALDLFLQHRPDFMSHVLLSHLSKDNNNPHLVMDLFYEHAGMTTIVHASRYEETGVYRISGKHEMTTAVTKLGQMSLF